MQALAVLRKNHMSYKSAIHMSECKASHANSRLTSLQSVYLYSLHSTLAAINLWPYSQIWVHQLFAHSQTKTTVKGMLN